MPTGERSITLDQAIHEVIAHLDGSVSLSEVVQRVLAIRPSAAKRPQRQVRDHLSRHWNKTWVCLDDKRVIPLHVVLRGARFRIVLSRLEIKHGALLLEHNFRGFVRLHVPPESLTLLDATGQPLPARPTTLKIKHMSLFGEHSYDAPAWDMSAWLRSLKARDGDSLLVTVEDWTVGRYRLEHEPAGKRRFDEVDRKNRELADLLFQVLEEKSTLSVYGFEAVPKAYARMADPCGYPGDPWMVVVERDSRMKLFDAEIRYPESYAPIEHMMGREKVMPRGVPFSVAQGQAVYRFKVALEARPGLWRRIEIQGAQTLRNLDDVLRSEFGHDFGDHMSGFWRKVRRGNTRRFRDVDLGAIQPFDGGDAAERRIAALGLGVGDRMTYVYDFCDWIEHTLTLEAINEPDKGGKYPRVVGRNQPQYRDCECCQQRGRQTRATWVCHECFSEHGREMMLCQDCLLAGHEDHYADEIVY